MASLNLSANGPSISKSYQSVVNASLNPTSKTYAQWVVYSVSTPLVNAFQQDAGNKESVLKVQTSGDGELEDLIEEFSEGRVQFAYVKVIDPNTGLPKNVLIGWCGEGVPERTKGYFTSHLASVSKFLHGYHVQITARAEGHLTPEGIIQRVADSSGSKYSADSQAPVSSGSRSTGPPPVASKPVFTPTRSGGIVPTPAPRPKPATTSNVDDDGWGADAPPVTRTQLEKVQPAYQPTRVNLQQLKNENQTPAHQPAPAPSEDQGDVVRGGYQPVGKVDIAAIRRQAAESGRTQDDRPVPVKGSYEPVGKVDIAAIRARAQKPEGADDSSPAVPSPAPRNEPVSLPQRPAINQEAERLTTLPKPKIANKFGGGPSFGGTKPPLPASSSIPAAAPQVGSASRTFADQGGKTPAQLWAERKARERGEPPAPAPSSADAEPIRSQASGQGEWKSSYAGKSWAPVQTVQDKPVPQAVDARAADSQEAVAPEPSSHVGGIRDQFAHSTPAEAPAPPIPQASRPVPVPGLSTGPSEPETEHDAQQVLPTPPPQPRSPTPPTPPVRESSPIQVAMPVGRGVTDAHEEQNSPPPAMPVQSLQEAVPDEQDLEDDTHDIGRAAAEATVADQSLGGLRALVKYDYEIGEDNEIELREGEYVTEIQQVDEDWWQGKNAEGKTGLFPAVYVELVDDEQPPASHGQGHFAEAEPEPEPEAASAPAAVPAPAAASSSGHTAKALYDYEAAEDNELSFPEHATIEDIQFPDDDWWYGKYNGAEGLFPANYVELN